MNKPYVYVLIRQDISLEQQLVQASHAALEAGFRFQQPAEDTASLIMLAAKDEHALRQAALDLESEGIDHHMFYEPDFGPMGHSALATRPLYGAERKLMRKYPLYRAGKAHAHQEGAR